MNEHDTIRIMSIDYDKVNKDVIKSSEKVIDNGFGIYFCPNCKGTVWQNRYESNYCFRCGEKLNW